MSYSVPSYMQSTYEMWDGHTMQPTILVGDDGDCGCDCDCDCDCNCDCDCDCDDDIGSVVSGGVVVGNNYSHRQMGQPIQCTRPIIQPPISSPILSPILSILSPHSANVLNVSITVLFLHARKLSRFVKLIAILDIMFSFLYMYANPHAFIYGIVNLVMGCSGYIGGHLYNSSAVLIYFIYNVARLTFNTASVVDNGINVYNDDARVDFSWTGYILINSFILLIELYLARVMYRLYKVIQIMTDELIQELRQE